MAKAKRRSADPKIRRKRKSAATAVLSDTEISSQRRCLVEERAYFEAQRRGFQGGDPVADWLRAEREIDAELGA